MAPHLVAEPKEQSAQQHQSQEDTENHPGAQRQLAVFALRAIFIIVKHRVHRGRLYRKYSSRESLEVKVEAGHWLHRSGSLQHGEIVIPKVRSEEEQFAEPYSQSQVLAINFL